METAVGVIIGLIILVILVVAHEFGHAWAARRNGVLVKEFGIGFPPRAYKKKLKNGILFAINWLPLGGYVKLKGEYDSDNKPGDYGAATFWQKTKILLAGVVFNWLVAALIFTILAWSGLPKIIPNQFSVAGDTSIVNGPVVITDVVKDFPADKAGLKPGDYIIKFDNQKLTATTQLVNLSKADGGKTVPIEYERNGKTYQTNITPRAGVDKQFIGVGLGQSESIKATWSAPIVGVGTTIQLTGATLQGVGTTVGNLVGGLINQLSFDQTTRQNASSQLKQAGEGVAGPIGILGVIFPAAEKAGLTQLLFLSAIISLTLAVMNILPIPALDGGRWAAMAIFRLIKKPLTKQIEEKIQTAGFMLLIGLTILVTIGDVTKLF